MSHNSYYVNICGLFTLAFTKPVNNPVEMCRGIESNLPKINGYLGLHRFRSPAPLLKSGAKIIENGPYFEDFCGRCFVLQYWRGF